MQNRVIPIQSTDGKKKEEVFRSIMNLLFPDARGCSRKDYLEKNHQDMLRTVCDDDSYLLTLLAASPEAWEKLPQEQKRSLLGRGLADEDKTGAASVSAYGMKAVSYADITGREQYAGRYPESLIPAILSMIGSGTIPEKESSAEKYLSSALFTSRFPSIDEAKASRAAMLMISSLLTLGVAEKDSDGMLYLSQDSSKEFALLPLIDAIGYLLHPEYFDSRRRQLVKAISILALSRGGDKEKILGFINDATDYDISSDIDALSALLLIEVRNDRIYAYDTASDEPAFSLSSDLTIALSGRNDRIYLYAEPLSLGEHISQWQISKQSVKTAFSLGYTYGDIVQMIRYSATYPVSDTVFMRIQSWYESFNSLKVARGVILAADERNARIIDALSTLQMHIIGKLGGNIYLMNPATERLWRRILSNEGFDMLPRTKGPRFIEESEEIRHFEKADVTISIPEEREIPYSQELVADLESKSDSPLRTFMIRSGLIYRDDIPTPDVPSANGLYYQEKLSLISSAASKGDKILIEMLNGDAFLGHPVKTIEDDDTYVSIEELCRFPVSKIWKASTADPAIRSGSISGES